ncbi:MAG: hypothetical protein Ta2D_09990 [Rickettsiales bacterium]|nr:MAG: hypothetical protein Ta2D_09990 [Rickettsiales bacterium]
MLNLEKEKKDVVKIKKVNLYYLKNREQIIQKIKERYKTDPKFREKTITDSKNRINKKYKEDPEFRKKVIEYNYNRAKSKKVLADIEKKMNRIVKDKK